MNEPTRDVDRSCDSQMADLLDEFTDRLNRGEEPDIGDYVRRCPEQATVLRQALEALLLMRQPAADIVRASELPVSPHAPGHLSNLGDFRILREIGRGGMGVVYEAEQVSLGRRLALKVLPFAATLDPRQLQRFRNEAQAAAALKHPNIVGIHSVGCERGVHYYAMELVEGRTLDQLIEELRHLSSRPASADALPPVSHVTRELVAGRLGQGHRRSGSDDPTQELAPSATPQPPVSRTQSLASDTQPEAQAAVSTQGLHRTTEFFRSAAQLGIQAAEALEHAHQMGVVHRDIKPSNLMVDDAGHLWITDFGLAMTQKDPALTMTGDIVGTLRYMSPEQAVGRRREMDHRTDIYSLGITLYELLTLRPAFVGESRATLVRSLLEQDPPPPRRVDPAIPRDLETIVLKATAKESSQRYPTVQEMADDLKRFLTDEPIHARRASLANRTAKWARRHRPVVWSAVILLMTTTVAIAGLAWNRYRQSVQLASDVAAHVAAADAFLKSADYAAGDRELADARGHMETADYGAGPLAEEVDRLTAEFAAKQRAIEQFDQFQQLRHRLHSEMYAVDQTILGQAQEHSRAALNLFGVFEDEPWKSRADFRNLDTARQAMLDEGAVELLFISARLELGISDTQPAAERTAGYRRAIKALEKIETSHPNIPAVALWMADCWAAIGDTPASAVARARAESLPPKSATDYYLMGEYHAQRGQQDEALASYWQALARQPDHYLSLLAAGVALGELKEYKSAEAMLTGAIAMYPQTTLGYVKRGASRLGQGKILLAQADFQEAVKLDPELAATLIRRAGDFHANLELDKALADLDEAIRLDPKSAWAYAQRSLVYITQGDMDKVIADSNAAIQLDTKSALAYTYRATAYRGKGQLDKALADSNEAIRLAPTFSEGYFARGAVYSAKGELDKALADLNEALRLDPKLAAAFLPSRADVYRCRGEYDKAMADCDEAIRFSPKNIWAYFQRAAIHEARGDVEKALAEFSRAIDLNRDIPWGYRWRALILQARGDLDKALADYSEAIRLGPTTAGTYVERAGAYLTKGDSDKALADYSEAIRLEPEDVGAYIARAGLHRDRRDFEKALADYSEAIRLAPQDAGAYIARAGLHKDRGDFDRALADYNEAIRLEPSSALPYVGRAAIHNAKRDHEQALADFEEAIRLEPSFALHYAARACILNQKGDHDKALADCNEAIRLDPKLTSAYIERGTAYTAKGDRDKALADYNEGIRFLPNPKTGDGYGQRGTLYLYMREFEKAAADLDRAAELAGISYHYYKHRAVAHFQLQHYDKALESIVKAVDLTPGDLSSLTWLDPAAVATCPDQCLRSGLLELADKTIQWAEDTTDGNRTKSFHGFQTAAGAYRARAILYAAFGQPEKALADFAKAIELEPQHPAVWAQRAGFYIEQGKWEQALADFEKALEVQPANAGDCNNLAWYLATCPDPRARKPERAVELATKATELAPNDGMHWNTLGIAQYRAGQFNEAITTLTKSMELRSGGDAFDSFFLAMAQWQLNNKDEARTWYDKAIEWTEKNKPDHEELLRFRAEAAELLEIAEKTPVIE